MTQQESENGSVPKLNLQNNAGPIDTDAITIDKIFSESRGVGYYRRYGMHFAVAIIILFIFFCLILFFTLQEKFAYYRNAVEIVYNDDGEPITTPVWERVKCKPHILPISGYIKKKPNETSASASLRYMNECIKVDTGTLAVLNPVNAASATISVTLNTFSSVLKSLRANVEDVLFTLVRNAKKVNKTTALHRYNIIEEIQLGIDDRIKKSVTELEDTINGTGQYRDTLVHKINERRRKKQEKENEKLINITPDVKNDFWYNLFSKSNSAGIQ